MRSAPGADRRGRGGRGQPGLVRVIPHVDGAAARAVPALAASDRGRPPGGGARGARLARAVAPQRVDLAVRLTTTKSLLEQDLRAAQRAVRERWPTTSRACRRLGRQHQPLVGLARRGRRGRCTHPSAQVGGVDKLNLAAGTIDIAGAPTVLGELQIADPNLPTLLDAVVIYPSTASPPDRPAIRARLTAADGPQRRERKRRADERTLTYSRLLAGVPLPGSQPRRSPAKPRSRHTPCVLRSRRKRAERSRGRRRCSLHAGAV